MPSKFSHFSRRFLLLSGACAALSFSAGSALAAYEKNYVGEMETYTAVYEDTLVHLARDHGIGFVEIRAANPKLDPWIPGDGAEVILPKRHLLPHAPREGIVINLPEMRVYAFVNGDDAPYTYPLGVGREGLDTPLGKTSVIRKKAGPTWRPTERMRKEDPELPAVVPPGEDNPLGTHALYLGWPTYAIHGTSKPYGIGRRVSSGCIRMYPEHIKLFFEQIPVGTKVNVVDQPIKVAWIDNELYLEAHPDMEQSLKMEEYGEVEQYDFSDADMERIIDVAGRYHDVLNWPRIRMALRERSGYPVRIARYFDENIVRIDSDSGVAPVSDVVVEDEADTDIKIEGVSHASVLVIPSPEGKPELPASFASKDLDLIEDQEGETEIEDSSSMARKPIFYRD